MTKYIDKTYEERTFIINMTHTCNYSCSFCINEEEMKDKRISPELPNKLDEYLAINHNNFRSFAISGGEPFSKLDLLEQILNVILKYAGDRQVCINTNASYLTHDMVEAFNSIPNLFLNIGMDGLYGERGFYELMNKSKEGIHIINTLSALNNKAITFVIPNFRTLTDRFVSEVLFLHKTFNCEVVIRVDENLESLKSLNLDDVLALQRFMIQFKTLGLWGDGGVTIPKFFTEVFCSCDLYKMTPKGEITHPKYGKVDWQNLKDEGCQPLIQNMKTGIYELLSFILQNSFKPLSDINVDLETTPKYFEDKNLIPIKMVA